MNKHWDDTTAQAELPAPPDGNPIAGHPANVRNTAGELPFSELLRILRRRSRFILAMTLCGTFAAFAVGFWIPPKYTAKAEIAIDSADAPTQMRDDSILETHVKMLLSPDHLQRVTDDLQGATEGGAASPGSRRLDVESPADRAPLRKVAPNWLPGPSELKRRLKLWIGKSRSSEDETTLTLDQLKRYLFVRREGRSRIISVSYTSTDPETAAVVANRVAEVYIEASRASTRADDAVELARLDRRTAELKAEIEQSGATVQTLVRQRSDATKPPGAVHEIDQRLQQIQREVAAKEQLYHMLLRKEQELRDQREITTADMHVLSFAATPDKPSSSNPFLFILPALILFPICGSLLSVFLARADRGLRSEREVQEALGIPCIGLVPQVAATDPIRLLHQSMLAAPFNAYAEALRSVATTMQLASPWRQPKVVLITSSLPGEGKSTLAVSLCACMALLRRRVLLIDFDSRQAPALREIEGDQHGVVDLLLNNASPSEVVQRIPELGIDYLPMNRGSVYPLIRFAAVEMPRLLHKLRSSYDCVMIKGPPVLGRSETRLLANLADEIIFVVKWGSTRRDFAQNALSLLRNNAALAMTPQLQSVSALITQVDLRKHARYGYGDVSEYFSTQEKYTSGSNAARIAVSHAAPRRLWERSARWAGGFLKAVTGSRTS